jgi:hypothetical protein
LVVADGIDRLHRAAPDHAAEILPALTKKLVTYQLGFDRVSTQL